MIHSLFIFHSVACFFMTGLIWFVQIVHYPLFCLIGDETFTTYEKEHQVRTSFLVIPVMLLELGSGLVLCYAGDFMYLELFYVATMLLLLIWCSTFFIQVPYHEALSKFGDMAKKKKLVVSNWLRTAAWTLRSSIFIFFMLRASM